MAPDGPTGRTLAGDFEHALRIAGIGGLILTFILLGVPAGIASLVGAEGAPDRLEVFIGALLFTLPLSGGILVWVMGLLHFKDTREGNGALMWTALVAIGAVLAAGVLGGSAVNYNDTADMGTSPAVIPIRVLVTFLLAYGEAVFFAAIVCGGILVWIYIETIYPRLKEP